MDRRTFLRSSALSAGGMILPRAAWPALSTNAPGRERIVVVGAGLAGLAAAYELDRAGHAVTVLEARSRPGGRVRTWRDPFADGLYAEMGAEYVDASDEYDHRYCREFGLKVLTAKLYDGIFVRGRPIPMAALKSGEASLPFEGIRSSELFGQEMQYTRELVEKIRNPERLPPEILKLDNLSVVELLLENGAPEDIIALYKYTNATESTARPEQMSALGMVKAHAATSAFNEAVDEGRIFGGNDQLPKAFARALADKVLYNRPVQRINWNDAGAEVFFTENGRVQSVQASRLVLALPFSVLRNLQVAPAFSAEKMHVIRTLSYGHVMKVAMQFRERFWDRPGSVGQRVFTDTRLRRLYHMSIDQPGPRGILMSFTAAEDAEFLGALNAEDRQRAALAETVKVWPEAANYWEGAAIKYWNEDPWVRGSYSFLGRGQKDFRQLARIPEGVVHFAGEHTTYASMNGAIESGVRVAQEILSG